MRNRVMIIAFGFICFALFALAAYGEILPVFISDDGSYILVTNALHQGLSIINTHDGVMIPVSTGINAGYYATISPDNRYVCFKAIERSANGLIQTPMLFDIAEKRAIPLWETTPLCGTPTIAADGRIAFTVGSELIILNSDLALLKTLELGHHVNLLAFSPAGDSIAFNDKDQQIAVLNIGNGSIQIVSDGEKDYWGPVFSPQGDKVLAKAVDDDIVCADICTGDFNILGKGDSPDWVDNETIACVKKTISKQKVVKSEVILLSVSGVGMGGTLLNEGDTDAVISGANVAEIRSDKIKLGKLDQGKAAWLKEFDAPAGLGSAIEGAATEGVITSGNTVQITGVPYIHQVYDAPEWFGGSWACGATSAAMTLAYYGCFYYWDCWCMLPSSHTSHYSNYIADTYTYNGHTFNIASDDPNGELATGGYGYIVQNNWEDTKTHMAEYISYHGPSSSVDWSPTFAKAQTEINSSYPFVLLNSLTTSGHYCACIGYYTDQYSLIFNDPYGNKNQGYMNYNGTGVTYDWPGYNYGNQNLTTVWCFIYARWTVHPTPTPPPAPMQVIVDNADAACTLSGAWTISTNVRGWYGSNYAVSPTGNSALATFYLNISEAGNYDISALWTAASDRSTKTPYKVYYQSGNASKTFDQTHWGGRFQLIGNYPFQAGQYRVELSANTGDKRTKYVIADAVRALKTSDIPTPTPTPIPVMMFVNDITMSSGRSGASYYANATVWIKSATGANVSGATVTGEWTGAVSGTSTGTTGTDGKVTLKSPSKKNGGTFNFCVTSVTASGYIYDPSMNIETCDSITAP